MHFVRGNLAMLLELPNYESMKFWEAETAGREWIWGVLPSMFLSELFLYQQYQQRRLGGGGTLMGGTGDRFETKWLCWPATLDISGLNGDLSIQYQEHVKAFAPVARNNQFRLQSYFKNGRTPPPGWCFYLQARLQMWWLFKKDGLHTQAYKIKGNVRKDGTYWVQNILLVEPSSTHELVSAVTAKPPNLQDWELPLFLEFSEMKGVKAGSKLHLYHCALVPSSFLEEVEWALRQPRGQNGHPGKFASASSTRSPSERWGWQC